MTFNRSIRLTVLCLVLVWTAAINALAGTYYIDANAANDTANGTSKSTPWKHCPGMAGFSHSYSHAAGDRFIFKGGTTWTHECFRMVIAAGGSGATNQDYYGVDATWFNGGAFTKPVFDFQGTIYGGGTSGSAIEVDGPWVTIDSLEMKGLQIPSTAGSAYGASSVLFNFGASGVGTVSNCYIHDWTQANTGGAIASGQDAAGGGGVFGNGCTVNVLNTTLDQRGSPVKCGAALRNIFGTVDGCEVSYTTQGVLGGATIKNSKFHDFTAPSDPAAHCNAIETFNITIVDNCLFYNLDAHTAPLLMNPDAIHQQGTCRVTNCVMFNTGGQTPVCLDSQNLDVTAMAGEFLEVFNCTIDGGGVTPIRLGYRGPPPFGGITVKDCQLITTAPTAVGYNSPSQGFGNVTSHTESNNVIETPAQATAAGYTSANLYAPQSGSAPTVNTGTSSVNGVTTDRLNIPRPQLSIWDVGAYEYAGGVTGDITPPSVSLTAPANGSSVSGTITVSATASDNAAVQSVAFAVDNVQFANDTTNPYSVSLDTATLANGSRVIKATAVDTSGNTATSSATVTVNNAAPAATPAMSASPAALDWGSVIASGTPADKTIAVTNIGGAGSTLAGSASATSPWSIVGTATYSLAQNASATITVRYRPTVKANDNGTVSLTGAGGTTVPVKGICYPLMPGLSFAADAGIITAPMTAAGGGTIVQSQEQLDPTLAGRASYGFTAPADGSYTVSVMVNAPNDSANSVDISIDGEPVSPTMIWDVPNFTAGTESRTVSWRGTGTFDQPELAPKTFTLTAGVHELVIRGREAGMTIGTITIASTAPLPTPPPAASNPFPATGANNVVTTPRLTWAFSPGSTSDIKLGITNPPPIVATGNTLGIYNPPSPLANGTIYYWSITTHATGGQTDGPLWTFTTGAPAPTFPTVAMTGPANGIIYTGVPANFTLTATANATSGSMTKVEFYKDGVKVGEDLTAPYSLAQTLSVTGDYSYTARAIDSNSNATTSDPITVHAVAAGTAVVPKVILVVPH